MTEADSPLAIRSSTRTRAVVWTVAYAAICLVGFPLLLRLLPTALHRMWTTTFEIAPQTTVTIDAHRLGGRDYSDTRRFDSAEIRVTTPQGTRSPIRIGPNVYIARYDNADGREIRGATPPEELFLQGWLKHAGAPESAAKLLQERAAQIYQTALLDRDQLGAEWTRHHTPYVRTITRVIACIGLFVIWFAGLWYTLIPRQPNGAP